MTLPYSVSRTIFIEADRDTVFRFFTDPELWAKWWGAGSTVAAHVGGAIKVRHSNGFESVGEVVEVSAPERFVFTFSMQAERIIPPEESRVTLELASEGTGTRVTVTHHLADEKISALMPQGWRFHLSMFANAVANLLYANVAECVDQWFGLWTEADANTRANKLRGIATEGVTFKDRFSSLCGIDDVVAQLGAVQRFMPGLTFARKGDVRHCQGVVLAEWSATKADGSEAMAGTSVFILSGGRIASVTGIAK